MSRVMIFLDGAYLLKGIEELMGQGWRLDYQGFVEYLTKKHELGRELCRTYFYNAWLRQSDDAARYAQQQKFISYLRRLSYFELRDGRLAGAWPNVRQKGVDVRIALDMVRMAYEGNYDVAILVSGDSDLVEAVKAVKDNGKHVELWYFDTPNARTADELHNACDVRNPITREWLASREHKR